jgi:hypothetical protein
VVNWFLWLAAIFVVRDRRSTLEGLGDAVRLFQSRPAACLSINGWFGGLRSCLVLAVLFLGMTALAMAGDSLILAAGLTAAMLMALSAGSAWLQLARVAAFAFLAGEAPAPESGPETPGMDDLRAAV